MIRVANIKFYFLYGLVCTSTFFLKQDKMKSASENTVNSTAIIANLIRNLLKKKEILKQVQYDARGL